MIRKVIFISSIFLLQLSCEKTNQLNFDHAVIMEPSEFTQDIKIPSKLWVEIEKSATGDGSEKLSVSSDDLSNLGLDVQFTPIELYLIEKNYGVLKNPSFLYKMPIGGGEIDLSNIVTDKNGSFYLKFKMPKDFEDLDYKVYFLSKSRKRIVDGETIGSGCNVYFNITKKFKNVMKSNGILVNTTRLRHVSLLAGNFIFVAQKEKKTLLTQVQFVDSGNRDILCEEL